MPEFLYSNRYVLFAIIAVVVVLYSVRVVMAEIRKIRANSNQSLRINLLHWLTSRAPYLLLILLALGAFLILTMWAIELIEPASVQSQLNN